MFPDYMLGRILFTAVLLLSTSNIMSQTASANNHFSIADGQFNFNIRSDVKGLDFIMRLKPVSYQFDIKKLQRKLSGSDITQTVHDFRAERVMRLRRTGFIAQEVEQAAKESGFSFTGVKKPAIGNPYYSIDYESFVVPLVQAIQDQQVLIRQQQQQIEELRREMEELKSEMKDEKSILKLEN